MSETRNNIEWSVPDKEEDNIPRINKKTLLSLCKKHDLYQTPDLNEKLYLHYGGFRKIENLEEYVNVKALWLQGNCLERIENIGHMTDLRCLFVIIIYNFLSLFNTDIYRIMRLKRLKVLKT
jgi:hypothetical protein